MKWLVMDATQMTFADDSIESAVDKGTLDSIMCRLDSTELAPVFFREVHRVLKQGAYDTQQSLRVLVWLGSDVGCCHCRIIFGRVAVPLINPIQIGFLFLGAKFIVISFDEDRDKHLTAERTSSSLRTRDLSLNSGLFRCRVGRQEIVTRLLRHLS